ncbi:hypothetical protein D3C80_1641520 [compost metagenome]
MHQPGTQHAYRIVHHQCVIGPCLFRRQGNIAQARRYQAFFVGDQFHQQYAIQTDIRLRHANARFGEQVQRIDLGVLPGFFLLLAAEFRAFAHGARITAVAHFAPFLIVHGLLEVTFVCFFVDFGAADLFAATHDKDVGFFATFQTADDVVD